MKGLINNERSIDEKPMHQYFLELTRKLCYFFFLMFLCNGYTKRADDHLMAHRDNRHMMAATLVILLAFACIKGKGKEKIEEEVGL